MGYNGGYDGGGGGRGHNGGIMGTIFVYAENYTFAA